MEEHTLSDSGNSAGSLHDVTDNDGTLTTRLAMFR